MRPESNRATTAVLFGVLAAALAVGIWYFIIWAFHVQPFVMPTPAAAASYVWNNFGTLGPMLRATVLETVEGFLAGAIFGFVSAVAMAQSRIVERLVYPILITSQAVPVVAVAPPLVILLGFGLAPKLIIVAWIVFFPVTVNVLDGLARVDRDILNLGLIMRGTRLRRFAILQLPAAIGPLFTGLKVGATYAVTGAVIGEWTASNGQGLGAFIQSADSDLNAPAVYGATMLLTLVGITGFLCVGRLERFATPWKYRSTTPRYPRMPGGSDGRPETSPSVAATAAVSENQ